MDRIDRKRIVDAVNDALGIKGYSFGRIDADDVVRGLETLRAFEAADLVSELAEKVKEVRRDGERAVGEAEDKSEALADDLREIRAAVGRCDCSVKDGVLHVLLMNLADPGDPDAPDLYNGPLQGLIDRYRAMARIVMGLPATEPMHPEVPNA